MLATQMITHISSFTSIRERLLWASFHCLFGTILLSLTVAGNIWKQSGRSAASELNAYWSELRKGESFDLHKATLAVHQGTTHNSTRYIRLHENWVQWFAGLLYEPLRRTQNTDLLIAGKNAECSERAQILKTIAEEFGHQCRFVGLGGHVVLEVSSESDWQVADPEFGLTFPVNVTQLANESQQPAIESALRSRDINEDQIADYVQIIQSQEDNVRLPIGEALSPRLKIIEDTCGWLAWIIPIACYVSALGYFLSARNGFPQSE